MKIDWVKDFYNMQYGLIGSYENEFYEEAAEEILSQIGKPVHSILELGSADGSLARALSSEVSEVTTVELVDELVTKARSINPKNIEAISGSFYDVKLTDTFDVILYIDGFGVGEDSEQLKLLRKIKQWMNEDGCALIDIYQPEHWKKAANVEMYVDPKNMPHIKRLYSYDYEENVMIDTWWHEDKEESKQSQYLKCYTPKEITEMCEAADLKIIEYFPNGAMDYEKMTYTENAPLEACMSYRIKVIRN